MAQRGIYPDETTGMERDSDELGARFLADRLHAMCLRGGQTCKGSRCQAEVSCGPFVACVQLCEACQACSVLRDPELNSRLPRRRGSLIGWSRRLAKTSELMQLASLGKPDSCSIETSGDVRINRRRESLGTCLRAVECRRHPFALARTNGTIPAAKLAITTTTTTTATSL